VKNKILLLLCWILFTACPAKPKESPTTQPTSQAKSGPSLPPKAPLLAPLGAGLGSETRSLLRFVPAKTELVVLADVERITKGPLWMNASGFIKKISERPEIVDFAKEAGFHPIQDVRGAVVALGDSSKGKTPSLLILRARFDSKKLTDYLEKIKTPKEEPLYLFARGSALALPAPEIILIGDPALVREAYLQQGNEMSDELRDLLEELDPARPFSFALQFTSASRAVLELPPEFDGAQGAAGWLDLSAGLEAKALIAFQTPEQAQLVLEDIERTWPAEKQAIQRRHEGQFYEKLHFTVEGNQLRASWELAAGDTIVFFTEVIGFSLENILKAYRVALPTSQPQSAPSSAPTTTPTTLSNSPAPLPTTQASIHKP
jgi:hypothetical protein